METLHAFIATIVQNNVSCYTHIYYLFFVIDLFIEPPSKENVTTAIKRLENVGALDQDENLTPLGHHLASLPVDVRIGQ